MKIYVQNGHNKSVLNSCNYKTATMKYLKGLITTAKNGDESAELAPITFVSNCGFPDDLLEMKMEKEYDNVKMLRTAKVFEAMGRRDIGKWMRKHEKTLNKELRKVIECL